MSHLRQRNALQAYFGDIMLYQAAGDLYRRTANKGAGACSAARLWFIRGEDMVKVTFGSFMGALVE
jgi:hypothetical protein